MFHKIGNNELYIIVFAAFIGLLFWYLHKQKGPKQKHNIIAYIFWGISGIFLLSAYLTPPDLISNLILSIPSNIIFLVIMIKKYNK